MALTVSGTVLRKAEGLQLLVVSKSGSICICSCSCIKVNLLERVFEVLGSGKAMCFLFFSVSCIFLGILFGQPPCSLQVQWQQCQKSCNPILYVDVCYVFSCNPVPYLLPQTIDGSKFNGHVTNDKHVMLPS